MALALRHTDIRIQAERAWLDAFLSCAPDVRGLIIGAVPYLPNLRNSRENLAAGQLREAGFGTLLVSLLTPYEESRDPDVRYDTALIHHRLQAIATWAEQQPELARMPLGILATGTIAGGAVRFATREPDRVSALVSKAGRFDLAGADPLRRLRTPILVISPDRESELLRATSHAYTLIGGTKEWYSVGHATATFSEPGTLDNAAHQARYWFEQHMPTTLKPAPELPPEGAEAPVETEDPYLKSR